MSREERRSRNEHSSRDSREKRPLSEDKERKEPKTYDRVVQLLNEAQQAQISGKEREQLDCLYKVKELVIKKEPALIDSFLSEILEFQTDSSADVRKVVLSFLEDVCKIDPALLPRFIDYLPMFLDYSMVNVLKKAILAMQTVLRVAMLWVTKNNEQSLRVWNFMNEIKTTITNLADSDNDGVRTHAIKFLETVAIVMSKAPETDDSSAPKEPDSILSRLPKDTLLQPKQLQDEGRLAFEAILDCVAKPHISSSNLMTCLNSLTNIGKKRPFYLSRITHAFEVLQVNLPPTLSQSQVSSVRKCLKMQLLSLLKLPESVRSNVVTDLGALLTDLGASKEEVMKYCPDLESNLRKRRLRDGASSSSSKKTKVEEDDDAAEAYIGPVTKAEPTVSGEQTKAAGQAEAPVEQSAIDLTAADLIPRLNVHNVADLVLLSMVMLPDEMPAQFVATYTPIAAAGTDAQIRHMARLLAAQVVVAGLGKRTANSHPVAEPIKEEVHDENQKAVRHDGREPTMAGPQLALMGAPMRKRTHFKLSTITKPYDTRTNEALIERCLGRIFDSEAVSEHYGASGRRVKLIGNLVTILGHRYRELLLNYVFSDLRKRLDLAISWLYHEYARYEGFTCLRKYEDSKPYLVAYDECLSNVLQALLNHQNPGEGLFNRVVLEAPLLTPDSMKILKLYCSEPKHVFYGMFTLKELILKRPKLCEHYLDILMEFCTNEHPEVRRQAITAAKTLHETVDHLKGPIEKYAIYLVRLLPNPAPPAIWHSHLSPEELAERATAEEAWTEDDIRLGLLLLLALLPREPSLIKSLTESPALLELVGDCPEGAEALVMRIVHILTERSPPSEELMARVRQLYERVGDVRLLIPIVTGLPKAELLKVLPSLLKLQPNVVKEVLTRIVTAGHQGLAQQLERGVPSTLRPLTPMELMIALHDIPTDQCDAKTVAKATSVLFNTRDVYTEELMASVIQQLTDKQPLPLLIMRTVIQTLALYPHLISFVMSTLQRLVTKHVWTQPKIWEGFVKCCQLTVPHSLPTLLTLPAEQLRNAITMCPKLREPLLAHTHAITHYKRSQIPKAIIDMLEKPEPTDGVQDGGVDVVEANQSERGGPIEAADGSSSGEAAVPNIEKTAE